MQFAMSFSSLVESIWWFTHGKRESIQGTIKFQNIELAYMEPVLSQIYEQLYRKESHKVSKAALVVYRR